MFDARLLTANFVDAASHACNSPIHTKICKLSSTSFVSVSSNRFSSLLAIVLMTAIVMMIVITIIPIHITAIMMMVTITIIPIHIQGINTRLQPERFLLTASHLTGPKVWSRRAYQVYVGLDRVVSGFLYRFL